MIVSKGTYTLSESDVNLLSKILLEDFDKFNVRQNEITFDDVNNGITLYHRPKDATVTVGGKRMSIIDSIFTYGFSREFTSTNGGNMYGAGVYTVYNLKSSNEKAKGYGSAILKLKLLGGYQDFLIFSKQLAQETYGNRWDIKQQIYDLFPKDIAQKIFSNVRLVMHDDKQSFHDMIKSSIPAYEIIRLLGESGMNKSKCRGIVYNGGHDGACCFIRDFSSVVPVAVSYDNGRTWHNKLTEKLLQRLSGEVDTHFQLGNQGFKDVADKAINGYTMVWNNGGKVNYVPANNNKPISDVWFDDGEPWKKSNDGTLWTNVKYNGYTLKIVFENGQYMIYSEDWEPQDCTINELPELLSENNMKLTEKDIRYMVYESVKRILSEAQNKIDNFDRIVKLMDFKSPDDFYFVQITKRFKDNPNDDRRVGNYHGGAWYLKGYRIHNANELLSLKDEIIDICDKNNARAYITVNTRSEQETDNFIKVYRQKFNPSDARYKYADQIIPGQAKSGYNWRGVRKRVIIDIDVPKTAKTRQGENIWDEVHRLLNMVNIKPLDEYETPSGGLHIILPDKEDKNYEYLKQMFHKFDNWKDKGRLATVHPNEDAKLILYSNVNTKGY